MIDANALDMAKKRAKQLGWENWDCEKKAYIVHAYYPPLLISNQADEFFILMTPDNVNLTQFLSSGQIRSDTGWFGGNRSNLAYNQNYPVNFIFSGNVILATEEDEGAFTCHLLHVWKTD